MDEQVYITALAGLLHDIGKFARRAEWTSERHAEGSGEFVRRYVPPAWRKHLYPVMGHHEAELPDKPTKLVALADRLSAGERVPSEETTPKPLLSIFCRLEIEGQRVPDEHYWPLRPLAMDEETLFPLGGKPDSCEEQYKNLWKDFEREIRSLEAAYEPEGYLPAYLEGLLLLMQRYTWCIPSAYYHTLPDVSLYDHSRTTAALAVCLMEQEERLLDEMLEALKVWHRQREKARKGAGNISQTPPPDILRDRKIALLVGGDISGVQDFIYTITSRGAASALRGRSFYLQLLTEAVARFVLRRLGLPITNLIYQGGGHFYLLARPSDAQRIAGVQQEVSRILLAHHRGDLYLALGDVPLTVADFYDGRITDRWGEVSATLRQAKQRRFAEVPNLLPDLFTPEGHGGNEERQCQVCGREHKETKIQEKEGPRKCPPCQSYEELGEDLRHARFLWLVEREPEMVENPMEVTPGGWKQAFAAFGLEAGVAARVQEIPSTGGHRVVMALEDTALEVLRPDARTAVGRRFLVNVTPIYREVDAEWLGRLSREERDRIQKEIPKEPLGKVKPFVVLEAQSTGIERLGILRMDVDDLGRIFQEGFVLNKGMPDEERIGTFSRVATLSFAISLFFEGWVEVLAERIGRTEEGQERLYSIYSGGDDLFFVGSWDAVVEVARAIRADLTRFAAGHPGVHASAGVALIQGKYPLYQAAQDARAAEEQAKSMRWREDGGTVRRKDAISFLGYALPWRRFGLEKDETEGIDTAHRLAHTLVRMVRGREQGGEGVPQSLVRTLIRLHEVYEEAAAQRRLLGEDRTRAGEEQVYWGPWMWRGYYFLKRMARRYKGDAPEAAIKHLAESLHGDRFRAIEWIGLAARWAELLVR
ncbi:MAG TPA: type III-A CRISPR-associated protein Cas10/Csm1 [Anaerolineae bacterium]|nr:type III-A CRISPR-associated protein Cas10/Csm1 [Anaerolineae bacterium]